MSSVPRLHVKPPAGAGVRLVGALLRCRDCHAEWTAPLDEWCEPVAEAQRCPRCRVHTQEPPAAA